MKDSLTLLAQYLRCFLLGLFLVPHLVSGVALAQTAESDLFHQLTARCDTDSIPTKRSISMSMPLPSSKTTSLMETLPKATLFLE